MTKEEIKALVAAKIAGQGSAIDSASVLPTILDAIVDAIPEVTPAPTPAEMLDALTLKSTSSVPNGFFNKTSTEAATLLGITEQQLTDLAAGKYLRVQFIAEDEVSAKTLLVNIDGSGANIYLGYYSPNAAYLASITTSDGLWGYEAEEV